MTKCINWQGATNGNGYGITWHNKKKEYAHRVAYIKANGKIPNSKVVMHLCDNRACVNTEHLKLATQSENLKDMVAKGRQGIGVLKPKYEHQQLKISLEQAEEIRKLYSTGEYSTRQLAPIFKIGKSQVHKIVTRGW
jgi:hypothetical protein